MAFSPGNISFGLDLRQAAIYHLDFLQSVEKVPELHGGQVVENAIQRYEKLWLPLAAKYSDHILAAPLDVEWVWHCHLLNPAAYLKDCRRVVGKIVDHRLLDRERRKQSLQESRVLWRREYPNEPFEFDSESNYLHDLDFTSASKITYNLAAAITRQKVFYYQVSLPHYKDERFLNQAVLRYKKFLHLKKKHPYTFIVPCYDIDLIWHTHMLHPNIYHHDVITILGHLFNHDDSVNDRRAGSKLTICDARTRHLWKTVFNEQFSQSGAMFRGEPPAGKLFHMDALDFASLVTKQTTIILETARVTGLPEHSQAQYKLKLWYNTGYQNFNRALYVSDSIATVRGSPRHLNEVRINANFTFDTKYNDVVMVDLMQKSGRFCLGATAEVGSARLRMLEKIQSLGNGRGATTHDSVDLGDGVMVQLYWSVAPPILGGYILALRSGDYEDCIMPETVESMWGPVPLPRLPPGVENKCSVASHSLLNHTKKIVFTCRIIHSLPLMMSAVHVFYKDKMVVVGHLVGADQLPLRELVQNQDRCVTLDIKLGERALLLKNHAGDWGVVLGRWTGLRKPLPGKPATATSSGRRRIPGDPGHLEVRFYNFSTRRWTFLSFERNYSGSEHKFQIEAATVELDSGMIEISGDAGSEVAENLALAFSVAVLHVLCQPRPKDWDPAQEEKEDEIDGESHSTNHSPRIKRRLPAESLMLVMAAGFLALAPSNHLLHKRKREALEAHNAEVLRRAERQEEEKREQESSHWRRESQDHMQHNTNSTNAGETHDVVALVTAEQAAEDIGERSSEEQQSDEESSPDSDERSDSGVSANDQVDEGDGVNGEGLDGPEFHLSEDEDANIADDENVKIEDDAYELDGNVNGEAAYDADEDALITDHFNRLQLDSISEESPETVIENGVEEDDSLPDIPEEYLHEEVKGQLENDVDALEDFPGVDELPFDDGNQFEDVNSGDIFGHDYHIDDFGDADLHRIGDDNFGDIPHDDFNHYNFADHINSDGALADTFGEDYFEHTLNINDDFHHNSNGTDVYDNYDVYSSEATNLYASENNYIAFDDSNNFTSYYDDEQRYGNGDDRVGGGEGLFGGEVGFRGGGGGYEESYGGDSAGGGFMLGSSECESGGAYGEGGGAGCGGGCVGSEV